MSWTQTVVLVFSYYSHNVFIKKKNKQRKNHTHNKVIKVRWRECNNNKITFQWDLYGSILLKFIYLWVARIQIIYTNTSNGQTSHKIVDCPKLGHLGHFKLI